MRKSFTRFLSVLMLFCAFGLQAFADISWDGTKSVPKDEYVNVKPADIATQFVLAFSDTPAVSAAGGTLVVYEGASTIVKLIPISQSSTNVTVVGKTLVVKHGIASFKEETNYHITLTSGAVTIGGSSFSGISGTTWSFTTGDFTAPKLATTTPLSPVSGATKVEANLLGDDFSLVVKFNEDVKVGEGNIAIYQENGTVVELIDVASLDEDAIDGATVTIPVAAAAHFLPETKYYVRIAAGAFTDDVTAYGVDAEANPYAGMTGNTSWTFTTRDTTAPVVTATVSDVTATTAKLNVKLSEAGSFQWLIATEDPEDLTGFTTVTGVAANTTKVISKTGLTGGITYYAYVVASNSEAPPSVTELEDAIENKVEFKTVDNTGPVAQDRDQIVTSKKTTGVYMIFDEQVKGGTGSLVVRKASNNEAVYTLAPSAVTCAQIDDEDSEFDGMWKATINFGGALASNENYYVVFPEGFITDVLGNKYVSSNNTIKVPVNYTGTDAWQITSSDFEAPVVSFATTTVDETTGNIAGAAKADDIQVIFDEEAVLADGESWPSSGDFARWSNYLAFQKSGITVPASFSYSGNVITINPSSDLESNTTYTLILRPGVFMDATENENVLAPGKTITVTVGDNEAPTFAFAPTTELAAYTPMTIEFTKDVFVKSSATVKAALASSNLAGLIAIDKEGTAVADDKFTMDYDATSKTITVTPKTGNAYSTSVCADEDNVVYHLVLTTTNLVDSKFAAFTASNATSTTATTATRDYEVSDYTAPEATLVDSPLTLNEINADKLTITYDEEVALLPSYVSAEALKDQIILKKTNASGQNIPFTASIDVANKVITITPTDPWTAGTYYYGIGASMQDCANNVAAAAYKSFTITANPVPTTLKALSYTINGGSSFAIDAQATGIEEKTAGGLTIVVTFDQAIDDADLTIDPQLTTTLPFNAITSSSVNGNKLTINVPATVVLGSKTEYAITIPQGLVEGNATYDQAGTLYAQLPEDGVTFSFISKDIVAPAITATTPADEDTDVALDLGEDGLTLTFNEKVALGSGSITITADGASSAEQTITVNSANVTLDETGTVATVKVADLKLFNTEYTVAVEAEAFVDLAGNDMDADYSFVFTSEANTAPVVDEDGLYPADGADLVPYSLDLTMTFSEPVEQASVAGSRKLVYVYKVDPESATHASIDPVTGDIVNTGTDTQVYYAYVDIAANVGVSGNTVTVKGVTLTAGNEYYVLITPGAFKDKALPTSEVLPYAGITSYGAWNFFTGDVVPAVANLDFTKYGLDELVATDSDIKIVFSKAISIADGTAITNAEIPNLITLTKGAQNIEFTGTISADKKTITIDNSSLVQLGELKGSTVYTVSFESGTFKSTASGDVLGDWSEDFETSDYTAPEAPAITFKVDDATSVYFDTEDDANVHTAELKLSDASEGDAVKLYYFWTSDLEVELTAAQVKSLGTEVDAEDAPKDLVFNENMVNETEYKVVAIAEDAAGNLSEVETFTYTTDDHIAPELAGTLPTSLGSDDNLTLVFNEDVVPVIGAMARVIDANGVTYWAPITTVEPADEDDDTYMLSVLIDALDLPIADDVATYTVEIDPGMIVDVPRVTEDDADANTPNAFAGILGTSFKVKSDDGVAPELDSTDPESPATVSLNPSFVLNFSEPVELNDNFVNYVVYDVTEPDLVVGLKSAELPTTPYDIVNESDISGIGTSTITITTNRALVSGHTYRLEIIDGTFSDLSGNEWDNDNDSENLDNVDIIYTASDVVGLPVTFRVPQDGDPFYLPVDEPLAEVPSNVCIVFAENNGESGWDGDAFNYEYFRLNPNDEYVNSYDLASHLYLKVDGVSVPFTFYAGYGDRINIYATNGFAQYKGKTITYGFTNLYDTEGNLNAGAEMTLSIAEDAVEKRLVTFIPGDNDDDSDTKVNIAVGQTFKVEFDGIIYSYHATIESKNNLIMSASLLNSLGVFTMNGAELEVVGYSEAGGKSVVTLKATEDLESETVYTLTLNDNLIQIGQGNTTVLGEYNETFMTADVVAPKLIADEDGETVPNAYLPNNGGTIAKDQTLALAFDEPVKGAGAVEIHRWDGVLVASVDITGVESDEDDIIEIADLADVMAANPTFVTNTKYYVVVPAGVIVDQATTPNAYAGITKVNEWSFDLRDDANPVVTFVQNQKSGVAVDAKLQLEFDRPVDAITAGYGWIAVYEQEDGDAVRLMRIPPSATASDVTSYPIDLDMDLNPNTKYYLELGEGTFVLAADGVTPQKQVNIGEWWFTTEVNAAPEAVEYSPAKSDPAVTSVALTSDLTITFDQDIAAGTGNIQLHRKQSVGGPIITSYAVTNPAQVVIAGNKLTIPASVLQLQNNSEYYVIIPTTAIKNTSSSPEYFAGIVVPFEWQFTTINDQAAPTAVYSPITTGLKPADVKLTMTFNEAVVAGTGDVVLYNAADNSVVETIAVTSAMLVDKVVTITPTMVKEGMSYYVNVAAGVVKDIAGNNYAGVADKTTWAFSTGDFTAPKLVTWTPNATTTTDNDPTYVLTFDEDVVLGAGNLKIYKKSDNALALTIPVTATMVNGKVVTVKNTYSATLNNGLDKNTDYYVLVDAGLVKDAAGNASAAVADVAAWTFKTADFATGIENPINNSLVSVYPNPFENGQEVTVVTSFDLTKIVVTNIAGQVVKQVVNPTGTIQLDELRSGVYFMSLYEGNKVASTVKIVKR